ncbi:MAG: DUF3791 domain-containing protein [Bacteroidales bacterium]|nr:DUF3791 domain-containing protein [Bacteroidales bacterium]
MEDKEDMIELSPTELELCFAAISVESLSRKLGKPYYVVFEALSRTGAIKDYLIKYYDVLHTQSREYVDDSLIEYLTVRNAMP